MADDKQQADYLTADDFDMTVAEEYFGPDLYELFKNGIETYLESERVHRQAVRAAIESFPFGFLLSSAWGLQGDGPVERMMKDNLQSRTRVAADFFRALGDIAPKNHNVYGQFNHGLYTHNSMVPAVTEDGRETKPGSLNRVLPNDIAKQFAQGAEEDWPELILTCNHARTTDHHDISSIMRGFRVLAQDAFEGKEEIQLKRRIDGMDFDDIQGKKTLIVSSVDTELNSFYNGAALLDRLNEVREEVSHSPDKAPQGDVYMSEGAKRLAKLILKLMVEDPQKVDIASPQDVRENGIKMKLTQSDEPIVLRKDAAKIAQHIKLMGYSKGGNTVTDALRYLLRELRQPGPDGKGTMFVQRLNDKHAPMPLNVHLISAIMRNLGLLSVAAGEVPLTAEEKAYGMRRMSVVNKNDIIANHFKAGDEGRYGTDDDFYYIEGTKRKLGHDPEDALGTFRVGQDGQEMRHSGYLLQDADVKDRLRCYFASTFDRVAISDIKVRPHIQGSADPDRIEIGFAPGVATSKDADAVLDYLRDGDENSGVKGFGDLRVALQSMPESRRIYLRDEEGASDIRTMVQRLDELLQPYNPEKGTSEQHAGPLKDTIVSHAVFEALDIATGRKQARDDTSRLGGHAQKSVPTRVDEAAAKPGVDGPDTKRSA